MTTRAIHLEIAGDLSSKICNSRVKKPSYGFWRLNSELNSDSEFNQIVMLSKLFFEILSLFNNTNSRIMQLEK